MLEITLSIPDACRQFDIIYICAKLRTRLTRWAQATRSRLAAALGLTLALAGAPVYADEWTRPDTLRESAFAVALALDWAQTRWGAERQDQVHEGNRLLGSHPSIGRVNTYFGLAFVLHAGAMQFVPRDYRAAAQNGSTLFELGVVIGNRERGIGVSFPF